MGVKHAGKLLHASERISIDNLLTILRHRARKRGNSIPTVAFDTNWLLRKLLSKKTDPVPKVVALVEVFVSGGVNVNVVADGPVRHHSKKATIERVAKSDQAKLDCLVIRKMILQKVAMTRQPSVTQEELTQMKKEIAALEGKVKTKENYIRKDVPSDFVDQLELEIDKLNKDHEGQARAELQVAKTQADSVICYQAVHGMIDAAVANDTDFCVVAGRDMLPVKDFALVFKSKKGPALERILLAAGVKSVLKDAIEDCLGMEPTCISDAKFPLFESDDAMLRTMIAVGLGCDTLPNGVPKVGPKGIYDFLSSNSAVSVNDLVAFYKEKSGMDPILLHAFGLALLYEPGDTSDMPSSGGRFIRGPPPSLPEYLSEFADGTQIKIDDSVKRSECCGTSGISHVFATGGTTIECAGCKSVLCPLCVASVKEMDSIDGNYCIPCLSYATGVAVADEQATVAISEMRSKLRAHNVHDVSDLSIAEVEELFDAIVSGGHNAIDGIDEVEFPLMPSNALSDSTLLDRKFPFDLRDGAQFVRAEELKELEVCKIVHILAELLNFSSLQDRTKGVHERVLPDIVANFARGSRLDGGERLMKRANRHATDPRSPSIVTATGAICFEIGSGSSSNPCLLIDGMVRASMKDELYETCVCFSAKSLLACSCTCRAARYVGRYLQYYDKRCWL